MAGRSEDYQSSLGNDDIKDQEDAHESSNPVDKEQDIGGDSMAHLASNSIHRSSSRPQLDLSKAAIQGTFEERDPTILLPNQSDDISHLALDIGGSLIKLVYFSRHEDQSTGDKRKKTAKQRLGISNGIRRSYPILGGRLHFVKFETNKINECLEFIDSNQLHRSGVDFRHWGSESPNSQPIDNAVIKVNTCSYDYCGVFCDPCQMSGEKPQFV